MEIKYKIGDKVRIIANKSMSRNNVGDIGVITEINEKSCRVTVEGRTDIGNNHYYSDLELVVGDIDYEIY